MFHKNLFKKFLQKGGEEEMRAKLVKTIGVMVLVLGVWSFCLAGDKIQDITVKAYLPQQNPKFDLGFYQITPSATDCTGKSDTWPSSPSTSPLIDFGTLQWDYKHKIFRGQYYGAVDVGVLDNTGTAWTITHTKTLSLAKGTDKLDDNVNVVFYKIVYNPTTGKGDPVEPPIYKVSYGSSSKVVTKAQVSGGWLRIYYGVSGGIGPTTPNPDGCSVDAPGVTPVTVDKPYGNYQGTVTLTLAP